MSGRSAVHLLRRGRWPAGGGAVLVTMVTVATVVVAMTLGLSRLAFADTIFSDDFEDGNTSGWSQSGGTWSVVTDGSQVLAQSKTGTDARLFAGTSSWTAYTVQARVKPVSLSGGGLVALLARAAGSTTFYRLALLADGRVQLQAVKSGVATVLGTASQTITTGTWYTLAVDVSGSTVRGYLDGALVATGTSTVASTGRVGVQASSATAEFDDVTVGTGVTPTPTVTTTSASPTASPTVSPTASTPTPTTTAPSSTPPATSVVVAQDGSGNYTTVQAAVNAVPTDNTSRITIGIRPGTYKEIVVIPSAKPYISFVGLGATAADVVITYDNANGTTKPDGSGTYGTSGSASVTISGHDFTAQNLTFSNSFDEAAHPEISSKQAVAVLTNTDRLIFDNVRFLGNQDTLYHNSANASTVGRAYFRDCYVEGDVDFIFGRGTAVFDRCEIKSLDRGSSSNNGYVTAASTTITNPYGYLFYQCALTSDAAAKSVYLGRPWHPSGDVNAIAQVVFRDSTLGAHIRDDPWTDMSGFSWLDARFFEYHNTGAGATVTSTRPQLADADASTYTPQNYLAGADGWNPIY